ncbi:CfaE/CblD family pilus tip adhesin [Xanthomonas theicola]|nr:CfaE/CblD family pilus tip adhesin [Xanthomonas theicola]QNH25524.1 hypothetical protein G4Q83_13255 [Xanthomonas theicola]
MKTPTHIAALSLAALLSAHAGAAAAQTPAPGGTRQVRLSARTHMSQDLVIAENQVFARLDPQAQAPATWLACAPGNSPATGACPDKHTDQRDAATPIGLTFTDQNGHSVPLQLLAWSSWADPAGSGGGQLKMALNSTAPPPAGAQVAARTYSIRLPAGSVNALPAGTWHATLRLDARQAAGAMATYGYDITLDIDDDGAAIYFPKGRSMPLRSRAAGAPPSGEIALCLYDGRGREPMDYELQLLDPESGNGRFELHNAVDNTPIAYQVLSSAPGSDGARDIAWQYGQIKRFARIDARFKRTTRIPGLPMDVTCAPWTLRVKVSPQDYASKPAGRYSGVLRVHFTPST